MPSNDFWIFVRESTLNLLGASNRARTLNPINASGQDTPAGDPAAGLVRLLDEVLAAGLADHGENVDYAALRESPLYDEFRRCAGQLREFDPSALPDRDSRLAFWINLYNTLVLHGVIELDIRRSVMERRAGIAFFRQAAYTVGGLRMSCDDIEHGILRANRGHPFYPGKQFSASDPRLDWVVEPFEPRIHFALNCASRSCPPIRVYAPGKLDPQLELATSSFLAADVRIERDAKSLYLSSIFKWFAADFGGRAGTLQFIQAHWADQSDVSWLARERDTIPLRFKAYDWSLNRKVPLTGA